MPETKAKNYFPLLLLAFTALILVRLLPVIKSPLSTYGYDYGFYLFALNHATNLSISSFASAFFGGYQSPLFYLAHFLHIPSGVILDELFLLFSLSFGVCFYFLFPKNKKAAVFAVLLAAASVIQSQIYNMFLWKTALALPLVLLSIKFLQEKKYNYLILTSALILLTHRTTAIVYFAALLIYGLFQEFKNRRFRRFLGEIALLLLAAGLIYYFQAQNIYNFLHGNNAVSEGIFIEDQSAWLIIWPFLLVATFGAYRYIKDRQNIFLPLLAAISLIWIIFNLPFSHRIFIYLDISLIAFSAYGLGNIKYNTNLKKAALSIVLIFLFYQNINFTLAKAPLISPAEIQEIKDFRTNPPGQFVLATSAQDGPWLLGFADNIRLAAPGLFEDRFTFDQWEDFWHGLNRQELLWKYPRPLYIYERSYPLEGEITNCLKPLSQNFYQYTCP